MNSNNLKKRITQITALGMSCGTILTTVPVQAMTPTAGAVSTLAAAATGSKAEQTSKVMTAGVISTLATCRMNAASRDAEVSENEVDTVQATEEAPVDEWASRLMVNVEGSVNVRDAASETSNRVGCLRTGDVAEITGQQDGWYQIRSGNLTGYISSAYVVTGQDAKAKADSMYALTAKATADGLRVRSAADTNAQIAGVLNQGNSLKVASQAQAVDGWTAVETSRGVGYVKNEYVTVATNYSTGITAAEEQAIIAQQKAEAERKAQEEAAKKAAAARAAAQQSAETAPAQAQAVSAGTGETEKLAAILMLEAGGSYEGMVAVGAVVMNRVRSSRFPNTITGVLLQPGQFTTASRLQSRINRGLSSSALAAARAAMAGQDPTGGCLSFRSARTGHAGRNIGGNVFF